MQILPSPLRRPRILRSVKRQHYHGQRCAPPPRSLSLNGFEESSNGCRTPARTDTGRCELSLRRMRKGWCLCFPLLFPAVLPFRPLWGKHGIDLTPEALYRAGYLRLQSNGAREGKSIMFDLVQLKQVLRRLARAPVFTGVTLITLAAGVGGVAGMFSVVEGVLLKPLDYPHSDQLIGLWLNAPGIGLQRLGIGQFIYFIDREQSETLQDLGVYVRDSFDVTGRGTAFPTCRRSTAERDSWLYPFP
jgi:hypothetical protein